MTAGPSLVDAISAAQQRGASARPAVGGFPYLAEALREAGAQRIDVTVPSWTTVLTTPGGAVIQQGAPMVTGSQQVPPFDRAAFIEALRADQAGRISYPEWMEATWRSGVVWYQVDLQRRTCTYRSPGGEQYVEDYPAVLLGTEAETEPSL